MWGMAFAPGCTGGYSYMALSEPYFIITEVQEIFQI